METVAVVAVLVVIAQAQLNPLRLALRTPLLLAVVERLDFLVAPSPLEKEATRYLVWLPLLGEAKALVHQMRLCLLVMAVQAAVDRHIYPLQRELETRVDSAQ
jgi:hypothetical protein